MKTAILFLALIGSTIALQYPLQYEYNYEARLASTIPGLRPQVSGTGIKCTLQLQMKTKTQAIAQISNIQFGIYNGDENCVELRESSPLTWKSSNISNHLEEPFGVNFANEEGHVMTVGKADTEVTVNIKKAIIEAIRIQPMIEDLSGVMKDHMFRHPSGMDVYSLVEETLFGRCECQYTIERVPLEIEGKMKKDLAQFLKKDEQAKGSPRSGKSSVPELQDDLWHVIRSVDFDKCHDRVVLQHTGVGNMSKSAHAQMETVQSRSSMGTYILKGSPKNYRMERAVVEGDIVINPFGSKEDRVQTITNQTLQLTSSGGIITPMQLPEATRNVRTWRYEVASPFSAPSGSPKPWVNYYNKNDRFSPVPLSSSVLGMFLTPADRAVYKKNILHNLNEIVKNLETISIPNSKSEESTGLTATNKLYDVSKWMSALPVKDIESIFSQIFRENDSKGLKKQMLLVDLAAASGASGPMKVLLDEMHKGRISNERIVTVFMTMTNQLVSPAVIPDILKYARSVNIERSPLLASAVMINTASVVNRLCLDRASYNYSTLHPIYGNMGCNNKEIIESFLPFLEQKVKTSPKLWQKAIALEAISTMGTVHALPIMKKYIRDISAPEELRRIAIYALNRNRMSSELRNEVFDSLMGVVSSWAEKSPLRHSAFVTLLTWHPDAVWWQRMARATWRDPSQSFAAFFTFTAVSLAESTDAYLKKQAEYAAFALPLMKPYAPSIQYSYIHFYSRFNPVNKMKVFSEIAYIEALESILPAEIYGVLRSSYGGFSVKLIEFAASQQNVQSKIFELLNLLRQQESSEDSRSAYPRNPRDSSSRSTSQVFAKMDALGREDLEKINPYVNVLVRAFDNINAFIPITTDTINKIAGPDCQDLIQRLMDGEKLNMTKYANLMKIEYILPTDIGIPVIGELSLPTVNLGEIEVKLIVDGKQSQVKFHDLMKAKTLHLMFKSNYRLLSKVKMSLRALMPYQNIIVESGVESYKEINLPFWGNLTFINTDEIKNVTLNVAPYLPKFPVVFAQNTPFTAIRRLFRSQQRGQDDVIPIMISDNQNPLAVKEIVLDSKYTGMKSKIMYEGDVEYPFTPSHLVEYLQTPELFMKTLASPTSKHWKAALIMLPNESSAKNISLSLSYLTPHVSSTTPSKSVPDFSPLDSIQERQEKISEYMPGHQVRAVEAQLVFNSSSIYKKYASVFLFSKKEESDIKSYKAMLALMATVPEQEALCLDVEMQTPRIKTYKEMQDTLKEKKMVEELNGELYYGRSCAASSSITTLKVETGMSDIRKVNVTDFLNRTCAFDARHPVVKFQVPAIYDEIKMNLTYKERSFPKHLLNASYILERTLEGYFFPLVTFNRMDVSNKPSTVSIIGHRNITSKLFVFHVQKPKENVTVELVNIPNYFTQIVPFYGLEVKSREDSNFIIAAREPEEVCQVRQGNIVTFDGNTYNFKPIHCYTTALTSKQSTNNAWVLHTRVDENSKYEARLSIQEESLEVIIRQNEAFVNKKRVPANLSTFDVKDKNGRVIVQILKHTSSYEMRYIGYFDATVNKQLTVVPTTAMKGMYAGLCGNFDGNPSNDRVGPKGCLYEDDELFKYSWAIKEGESCDQQKYEEELSKIIDFQKDCPKPSQRRQTLNLDNMNLNKREDDCTRYVYLIVSNKQNDLCVSQQSVEHCVKPCKPRKKIRVQLQAKCWEEKHIPEKVRAARSVGYMTYSETAPADYTTELQFRANEECHVRH